MFFGVARAARPAASTVMSTFSGSAETTLGAAGLTARATVIAGISDAHH
jgi:hypothetical protein